MKNPRRKRTGYLSARIKVFFQLFVTPQSGGVLDPGWNKKSASFEADFLLWLFQPVLGQELFILKNILCLSIGDDVTIIHHDGAGK